MQTPLKVFVVYAHEDKPVRDKLLRQLRPLADNGEIDLWSDHEIKPGSVWDDEIRVRLAQSDLILLLVSDDFFASDYIRNVELREAFDLHVRGETRLLPVITRHCGWEDLPALARLQVLPPEGRPVVSKEWDSPDEPYRKIYEGVKTVVRELRRSAASPPPTPDRPQPSPPQPSALKYVLVAAFLLSAAGIGYWRWPKLSPADADKPSAAQPAQRHPDSTSLESKKPAGTATEQTQTSPAEVKKDEPAKPDKTSTPPKTNLSAKSLGEKTKAPETQPQPQPKKDADTRFDRRLPVPVVEGMARVMKGRKYGFLNTDTDEVIGWYDNVENFNEKGRASVKQNERYFWIDKTGKEVKNDQ